MHIEMKRTAIKSVSNNHDMRECDLYALVETKGEKERNWERKREMDGYNILFVKDIRTKNI